ncbi:MAG: amino acid adenylation domain-containing protein [Rhizonema sp. PD38]|nr:amino acid adenylation domain-containing protein [Rhizonema sp. PD38]
MLNDIIEGFELSPHQKRLWLLQQNNLAYRSQLAILIEGNLNIQLLKEALHNLTNKHEILRTTFHTIPDWTFPIQRINNTPNIQLQEMDLRSLSFERQQARIEELFQEEGQYSFHFEQEPLVHWTILTLSAQKYTLLLTLPALCADTRTLKNIVKEISSLYAKGRQYELHKLPIQHVQFSAWQNEILEEYEQKIIKDLQLPKNYKFINLKLPFEAKPVKKLEFKPQFIALTLSPKRVTKIKTFVQKNQTSTSVFLLTCWQVLLWRLTGQSNIVIGTLCDGRSYQELEEVLGLLTKNLPIHYHLEDDESFWKSLQNIDKSTREAYAWQDYFTLEQKVGESENLDAQSLSLFCFDFEEQDTQYSADEVSFRTYRQYTCIDRFKVKLSCIDREGIVITEFHYDSSLFSVETIERLAGQFNTLLESVLSNSDMSISQLQILSAAEQQRLLVEWNKTQVEYPQDKCIHQLFEDRVEQTPDAIAVVFEDEQLTYRDLNERANQLAHHLQTLGVEPDVLVGICVERSLSIVIGLLGILKAGGAYIPLDPSYPQERLAFILENSQPSMLLTQQHLVESLPTHKGKVFTLDSNWERIAQEKRENLASTITPDNLAYVIYTSGSTGRPKGAMNTHKGMCNRLLWMQDTYQLTAIDQVLQKTPFSFDVSIWEFFWPLMTGARLAIAQPGGHQDPNYLVNAIAQQQITTLHFVPSMLQVFLEAESLETCKCLKQVITSGEVLPIQLQKRFFNRLDAQLHNLYGPTEASIDVTYWECVQKSSPEDNSISYQNTVPIGRPIANTQIYLLDRYLNPVLVGITGEVYIGGVGVGRGYLNNPELTAEKFIPNRFSEQPGTHLYKTGDLARYLPNGEIEYIGRIDYQVKLRGFRIELGEIEAHLSQHPAVRETVVVVRSDSADSQRIVAYIVAQKEQTLTITELRDFLKSKLPNYMVPAAFVMLAALPLIPNGKVDRKALAAPDTARPKLEAVFQPPQSKAEKTIANIWLEVLHVKDVGIHDNFFELGGHSLLLVQAYNKLYEIFESDLSILDLIKYPTISSLADYLNQVKKKPSFRKTDIDTKKIEAGKAHQRKRQSSKK